MYKYLGIASIIFIFGGIYILESNRQDDFSNVELLSGITYEPLTEKEQAVDNGVAFDSTGIGIDELELAKKMENSKDLRKHIAGKRFNRSYDRKFGSFAMKSHNQQLKLISQQEDLSDPSIGCGHSAGEVTKMKLVDYDHSTNTITYPSGNKLIIGIDAATDKARVIGIVTNGVKEYDYRKTSKATQMLCISLR